jgi:antirestriction protein ArdC
MVMSDTLPRTSLELPTSEELLSALFDIPGSTGETYSRLHNYSPRNLGFLALQGCPPQPVATYKRWKELGFQVQRGEKAYSILRPIQVRLKGEDEPDTEQEEDPKFIRRFKVVKALFHYGQVAGDGELPPYVPRDWSVDRALDTLDIVRAPFESYNGNIGGYAFDRNITVSPLAPYPLRTTVHEMCHVEHGHTAPEGMKEYQTHRGAMEFEGEASAFVTLKEIDALDDETAQVSRGYVQSWMRNERPSEQSLRRVLSVATRVIEAGYEKEVTNG